MTEQLKRISEILKSNPHTTWSYEDFAAHLYEKGIRALPVKAKAYVVVSADNVSYDIQTTEAFADKADAYKALLAAYNDILDTYDSDQVEEKTITEDGFSITVVGDDLYYGNIKEIEVEVK